MFYNIKCQENTLNGTVSPLLKHCESTVHLEVELGLVLSNDLEHSSKSPGDDPGVLLVPVPDHGEGFTRAGLTVCKDTDVEAIDGRLDQPSGWNT